MSINTNLASHAIKLDGNGRLLLDATTNGVTGTLPLANGGTNSTTAQGAINTLAGSTTAGQYLRGNGTNVVMANIAAADVPTLNQNTTGNAATATALQTARNINSVPFNGTADITVTANTTNALTFASDGSGVAAGTTFNGSTARILSYNTLGAPSTTGANASGTWGISISGNAATATTATTATTANATAQALTFSNTGNGAGTGTTFNGGTARTISYNSVGAPSTTGSGASGNWPINAQGLSQTLAVGSGGTGLTSPGASGNVLTSNGTAWVSQASSGGGVIFTAGGWTLPY